MERLTFDLRVEAQQEIPWLSKKRRIPHEVAVELFGRFLRQRYDDKSGSQYLYDDSDISEHLARFLENSDENLEAARRFLQLPHLQEVMLQSLFGSFENMAGLWPNMVELRVESEDKHVQEVCKVCQSLWPGSSLRPHHRRERSGRTKKTESLDTTPGTGEDPSNAVKATEAGQ